MTVKAYIILGGIVNTAFIILHLIDDWDHLHLSFFYRTINGLQTILEIGTNPERILIFTGCVLCTGCYLAARRLY